MSSTTYTDLYGARRSFSGGGQHVVPHHAAGGELLPAGSIQTWEIPDVTNTRQKLDVLGAVLLRARYLQTGATAPGGEFLRFAFNEPNDIAAADALVTIGRRFVIQLEDDWRVWYFDPDEPLTRIDVIASAAVGGAGRSNLLLEWVLPA